MTKEQQQVTAAALLTLAIAWAAKRDRCETSPETPTEPPSPDTGPDPCTPSIYFGHNEAELDSDDQLTLQQAALCIRGRGVSVRVVGHASDVGADAYNRALARRRAEAVSRGLQAAGVEGWRITIESRGESDANPTKPAESRRVDVRIEA